MERIKRQILQAKISHTYSDPTIYETLKDIVFYLKHGKLKIKHLTLFVLLITRLC